MKNWIAWISSFNLSGSSFKRDVLASILVKIMYFILGFVVSVLAARLLGIKDYGIFSFFISITAVLAVFSQLGSRTLLLRHLPPIVDEGKYGEGLGLTLVILLIIGAISSASVLAIALLFPQFQVGGENVLYNPFNLFLLVFSQVIIVALSGVMRAMKYVVFSQIIEFLLIPIMFLVALSVFSMVFESVIWSDAFGLRSLTFLLGAIFQVALSVWLLKKVFAIKPVFRGVGKKISHTLVFSAFEIIRVLHSQFPLIALGVFASVTDIAIFRVAFLVSLLVGFTLSAFGISLSSRLSSAYAKGDLSEIERLAKIVSRNGFFLSFPAFLLLVLAGPWLFNTAFGPEFAGAYYLSLLLAGSQVVYAWTGQVGLILNLTGFGGKTAVVSALALLFQIVLFFVLVPFLGGLGAAGAFAASEIFLQILLTRRVINLVRVNPLWLPRVK
ncbi:MAG: oligosaccharide flippase family protein [Rhodobacteraceae bacterium]|nr:oligosaccharide flippase family protein [Paracoccaceae bacterium]